MTSHREIAPRALPPPAMSRPTESLLVTVPLAAVRRAQTLLQASRRTIARGALYLLAVPRRAAALLVVTPLGMARRVVAPAVRMALRVGMLAAALRTFALLRAHLSAIGPAGPLPWTTRLVPPPHATDLCVLARLLVDLRVGGSRAVARLVGAIAPGWSRRRMACTARRLWALRTGLAMVSRMKGHRGGRSPGMGLGLMPRRGVGLLVTACQGSSGTAMAGLLQPRGCAGMVMVRVFGGWWAAGSRRGRCVGPLQWRGDCGGRRGRSPRSRRGRRRWQLRYDGRPGMRLRRRRRGL